MPEPFNVIDCSLVPIATGEKAYNLRELKDRLMRLTDKEIMYYHFWDVLLRPHYVDPEYQNDFAAWAYHQLHDKRLAERLSIINPVNYQYMSDLRMNIIEAIEERMDEDDFTYMTDVAHPFFFLRSQLVVIDTRTRINTPEDLAEEIAGFSQNSIFYHFIDSRRRTRSGDNDFTVWLKAWGDAYGELAEQIARIDPYFTSLAELQAQLTNVIRQHFTRGTAHGWNT